MTVPVKKFDKIAAQGDMLAILQPEEFEIPEGFNPIKPNENNCFTLAHSGSGHTHECHASLAKMYESPQDPFVAYLRIDGDFADFVHNRSFDTHETLRAKKGTYEIRRQQEFSPDGWRAAQD